MLINQFKDIEFDIVSIATSREEMNQYAYQIPDNVRSIQTIYLADYAFDGKAATVRLNPEENEALSSLFSRDHQQADWKGVMELIKKHKSHLTSLLMSQSFYEICLREYKRQKSAKPFFSFLWNYRSMYFPFLSVLNFEIPEADVYHSVSTGYAGLMASVASYMTNKPFLLTEHGIYTREREEDIIRSSWVDSDFKEDWILFFKKLSHIAYMRAEKVISLFGVNASLQAELGCPEKKIEIIPNGVETDDFANMENHHLLAEDGINIGAILRVVPIKDVKTMLLAFAQACAQVPNLNLYLMGNTKEDPEYFQECQEMVRALHLDRAYFLGQVNIRQYLPEIEILLLSSISEGQPLSILEGLAARIPYICTNVGDCRRLLEGLGEEDPDQAGFIVPVMESQKMADAIVTLASDPELRKQMGINGRKRICKYYQKKDFLDRYHEIYTEMGAA